MDLLETAVVDVALLMATARALRATASAAPGLRGRRRMCDELRRAAVAYLKSLLRSERSMIAAEALAACRIAAERRMRRSIAEARSLRDLMTGTPGALDGFAPARHDLWRLARLAVALRRTMVDLEALALDSRALRKSARQLGKRLRKALVGYVRAGVRSDATTAVAIAAARRAALDELGLSHDSATAAGDPGAPAQRSVGEGVARGLRDLVADWSDAGVVAVPSAPSGPVGDVAARPGTEAPAEGA